jgi:putative Ca2+/H+ antiporter (TMEM165/GDT1 family)
VIYVFWVATLLIMVGELADKSQLLALILACRYKAWQVLLGIFIATFIVHFFSTMLGQAFGSVVPPEVLPWVTGVLFVGFGVWTLRGDKVDDEDADRGTGRFGPVIATGVAFFFAELGDKTQIMTITIAADPGHALLRFANRVGVELPGWLESAGAGAATLGASEQFWAVTLGSTVGMVVADAIAIGVGRLLGKSMPELLLRRVSGSLFIVFGLLTVTAAILGA